MNKSSKKLSEKVQTLHTQFSRYGRNAREWMRKCVLLLPEIERNRVWRKKGFFSIYEYAAKLAGMSRETVNESLRVLKKIEDKPELMRVVAEKGLLAVRPIVCMATKDNAGFWAEKAKNMSVNTLETYVKEMKKQERDQFKMYDDGLHMKAKNNEFPHQQAIQISENIETLTVQISPETKEKLIKLKGARSWDDLFAKLLELNEKELARLKKEAHEKFKEMEAKKNKIATNQKINSITLSRYVPSKIQKYITAKNNGMCAFPGCTHAAKILHHTDRFAITRKHDPATIVPLCKAHHDLIHTGLIEEENYKILREPKIIDYKFFVDQQVATNRKT